MFIAYTLQLFDSMACVALQVYPFTEATVSQLQGVFALRLCGFSWIDCRMIVVVVMLFLCSYC